MQFLKLQNKVGRNYPEEEKLLSLKKIIFLVSDAVFFDRFEESLRLEFYYYQQPKAP